MKEFVFGLYRLEVDVEATRAYYEAHPGPWITCTCDGCRNFARAAGKLPRAVTDFFHALGLDPEKPGELMYYQGHARDPLRRRVVPSGGPGGGGFLQTRGR